MKTIMDYEIVLEGQTYVLTVGRCTYRLPQCVCQVHKDECSYGRDKHPVYKPHQPLRAWTVENVRQLADLVARGNVPAPNRPAPLRGRVRGCSPAKRGKTISPEQVEALQELCTAAESRGGYRWRGYGKSRSPTASGVHKG